MAWRRVFAILVLLITFSATLCLGDETEGTASEDDSSENEEDAEETRDENANVDDEVKEEDDVLVLITKTFDSVVNDKDVILVEFYAPCSVKPCDGETTHGKTEMSNNNGAKKKSKKGGEALSVKCQNEVAGRSNNAGGGGGGGSDDEDNRKPHVPLSRYERDDQAFAAESDDDGGSNADDYKCEVKLAKKRKGIEDICIHGGDGNEDDGNQGESDCSVPPFKLKRLDAEVNVEALAHDEHCQALRGYMKNNSLPDDRNWKRKHDKLFFEPSPPRTPTVTLPGNLCLLPFEASESASFASDTGENSFTSATTLQNQCHVVREPDFGSDMFSGVNLMQQQRRQNVEEPSNCSARSGMASLQPSRVEEEDELPASPLSASSMPGGRQPSVSVSIPQEVLWPLNRAHLSVGDDGSYVENVHWKRIVYIGGGSCGHSYQCMDLKTGKLFAIKFIREDSFEMTGLEIWGTMSGRHDNILELYGAVKSCGKITIFMEYMSGGSLKKAGKLDEGQALNIYSKILSGIEFMHSLGYFHRDISAANILIDDRGETAKLADFNLSIRLDNGYQQDDNPRGTVAFMAPEVCRSENYSFSADIWSATCVLYQMLTGTSPWEQYHHGGRWLLLFQIGSASEPPPLPVCSPKVKELLTMGFGLTPEKRATAAKLLNHRAFKSDDDVGDYGDDVIGVGNGASGSTNATDSDVSSAEGDEWQ